MKKVLNLGMIFTLGLMLSSFVCFVAPQNDGDRLVGVWQTGTGKAKVKIDKIGTKYYGKIVWLKEPIDPATGKPKVDKNNPDAAMRTVPLKGYRMLKDFVYKGSDEWSDGTIYDPENGSTYKCVIKMKDNNALDIRGYIGVQALGRTDKWTRMKTSK
jgi:uncharacterized protein (DUF2147 family)